MIRAKRRKLTNSFWILLLHSAVLLAAQPQGSSWRDLLVAADSLYERGLSDSAAVLGLRALSVARSQFGQSDTNVALALYKLGIYYSQGDTYGKAEERFKEAIAIQERLLPPNHVDIGRTLSRLGRLLLSKNRDTAEVMLRRSLEILERSTSATFADIGRAHMNLGSTLWNKGRIAEARTHFETALELFKRERADHPEIVHSLVNLGIVNYGLGLVDESIRYFDEAVAFYDEHPQPSYLGLGNLLSNYGALLSNQGKLDQAVPVMKRAIAISEAAKDTAYLLLNLANLGTVYEQQKDYKSAEETLLHANAIYTTRPAQDQKGPIEVFTRLGWLYRAQGKYEKAMEYILRERDVKAELYGPDAIETLEIESSLIPIYRKINRSPEAVGIAWRLLQARREHLLANMTALPERDALAMASGVIGALGGLLSSYVDVDQKNDTLCSMAARAILLTKGEVAENGILTRQCELKRSDTLFTQLLARSKQVNDRIAREAMDKGWASRSKRAETDSLIRLSKRLESEIAASIPASKSEFSGRDILEKVRSGLPDKSTLIEFVWYDYGPPETDKPATSRYAALVLPKANPVTIVDLGDSGEIDTLVNAYRRELAGRTLANNPVSRHRATRFNAICSRLYSLVWTPLDNHIQENSTLFICPDAGLNLVSFASLVCPDGSYLIEKHPVHYLTAGRDLIRLTMPQEVGNGILALGDPDYDAPVELRITEATAAIASGMRSAPNDNSTTSTLLRSGCAALNETALGRLAGTRAEVQSVVGMFRQRHKTENAQILVDARASEEEFKHRAVGSRILHLATHGFFLGDDCRDTLNKVVDENPLLQSGLFLAGANLHGRGTEAAAAEDGILTALEVAGMDLHNVDLVVLSACETALGQVRQAEGVFGLRRAFQLAGARTVVSSLWEVPDNETMRFMRELYAQEASTYPELMQRVALRRIRDLRGRGRSADSFDWAGFIAIGDWRIR